MDNTKIGSKEAIALLVTIAFNHIIINITKDVIDLTASASLLNILYIGIIAIIFTSIICYFLNKFPTFDLVDISNYLGGKFLKWIKAAGVRAIKTVAQTAVATIGTAAVFASVDWKMTVSASLLAGVISLLTSIAGLPEIKE